MILIINPERIREINNLMSQHGWSTEVKTKSRVENKQIHVTVDLVYIKYGEPRTELEHREAFVKLYVDRFGKIDNAENTTEN